MRRPKGFGKNYFTLTAIQAYNSQILLQQCATRVYANHIQISDECDDETEEELEDVLYTSFLDLRVHGGHCNCYYRRITRNRILKHPAPRLYIATHQFTNSVSSPPRPIFRHRKTTIKDQVKK